MTLSLINTKLFVHSCVSHPRFPLFDIILQHCYYVKSAVQAKASSQYLRGWRAIRPCPGSLPITQRERGVLLIARASSFFFFCRMFCQRRYQRSRGLVGMAASWEHISNCYCLWSFSLSITLKLSPFTPPTTPPPTPSFLWPIWVWRRDSQNKYYHLLELWFKHCQRSLFIFRIMVGSVHGDVATNFHFYMQIMSQNTVLRVAKLPLTDL